MVSKNIILVSSQLNQKHILYVILVSFLIWLSLLLKLHISKKDSNIFFCTKCYITFFTVLSVIVRCIFFSILQSSLSMRDDLFKLKNENFLNIFFQCRRSLHIFRDSSVRPSSLERLHSQE